MSIDILGWIKKKRQARLQARFLVADTKKTLSSLRTLPKQDQQEYASFISREILKVEEEIRDFEVPSPQVDVALKAALARAVEMRHQALDSGAQSDADPAWAIAAILEAYFIVMTGKLGRNAYEIIKASILDWVRDAVSPDEIDLILNGANRSSS